MGLRDAFWRIALTWAFGLAAAGAGEGGPPGTPRSFRFVHLSDLHCAHATVNPPGLFPLDPHRKDLVRSFAILQAAVRQINESIRPDFVLVTGDLIDRANDLRSLERVKEILDTLACPYYPVLGDHESREVWGRVFGPGRFNYVFAHGGWRFIALAAGRGGLDPPTLDWLEGELRSDTASPTALVLHRPLVVPEAYVAAARSLYGVPLLLDNAAEVLARLARHRNVQAAFSGHCHMNAECGGRGFTQYIAPGLIAPGHCFHIVEIVEVEGARIRTVVGAVDAGIGPKEQDDGAAR